MPDALPDEIDLAWFLKNRGRVRDAIRETEKANIIVGPEGQLAPAKSGREAVNRLYDLRIMETSADPLPIAPPVLSLTVDEPDQELDLEWTLPETYNELFLERSDDDGATWEPLATLPGTQDAYEDADVTPGTTYSYRIRGRVGGAYSAYSNIVSGELTAGCSYADPGDMGDDTAYFQGFTGTDFTDANLSAAGVQVNAAGGATLLSENGRKLVMQGETGSGSRTFVGTRDDSDVWTIEEVAVDTGYRHSVRQASISRAGLLAGFIEATPSGVQNGALWDSGVTSAPTIDTSIFGWNAITPDGLRLFGRVRSTNRCIERTIGGADVIIDNSANNTAVRAIDHCGEVVILEYASSFKVWKKVAGVWTHTATLGNAAGSIAFVDPRRMTGDGTLLFGNDGNTIVPYIWDLTGTGTLTATVLDEAADVTATGTRVTDVAEDGSVVVGTYEPPGNTSAAVYWLASESYSTARDLDAYLNAQGLSQLNTSGNNSHPKSYLTLSNVTVSAKGTQFAARAQIGSGGDRSIWFAAIPTPT